ncbi:hypothetical protein ACHWQZ_G002440 [Mnemiopsis leidyi]
MLRGYEYTAIVVCLMILLAICMCFFTWKFRYMIVLRTKNVEAETTVVQNLVAEAIHNVVSHNTKEGDFHNKHLYRSSKSDRELNVNSAIGHVTGRRDHPSLTRAKSAGAIKASHPPLTKQMSLSAIKLTSGLSVPTYNKERLASLTAASSLTTHVEKRVEEDSGGGEREKTSWESERG